MQPREDERREVPDRFLGTELAQAAAGEPAADGERQRDELAVDERRQADHRADDGAGIGPGNEPGEERAFEREVRRLVVEQQPRGHAGGERHAEREHEDQAVGPVAAFEDQDVAEPAVADEHGRQRGHDRELHDQRREQHLLGGEELSGSGMLDLLDLIGRVN